MPHTLPEDVFRPSIFGDENLHENFLRARPDHVDVMGQTTPPPSPAYKNPVSPSFGSPMYHDVFHTPLDIPPMDEDLEVTRLSMHSDLIDCDQEHMHARHKFDHSRDDFQEIRDHWYVCHWRGHQ